MYLSKVVFFITEQYNKMGSIKSIMKVIQSIENKSFGNVIKIYIFKLFYYYMNYNYELFKNYNFKANGIEFYNEFPTLYRDEDEIMLTYFFLPLNYDSEKTIDDSDYESYLKEMEYFELIQQQKFNIATKEMAELIKNKGLNLFLLVSINKIISNLALRNYVIDKDEYQNFSSYIKSLFGSNYKLSPELKNLLYLFYDENIYNDKMRPKLVKENDTLDQQLFEMLLYGFRFCVNTIDNSDKDNTFLFQSFFKDDAINSIKDIYIPGIDEKLYINKVNKKQFLN